jgi:hypothetical protein
MSELRNRTMKLLREGADPAVVLLLDWLIEDMGQSPQPSPSLADELREDLETSAQFRAMLAKTLGCGADEAELLAAADRIPSLERSLRDAEDEIAALEMEIEGLQQQIEDARRTPETPQPPAVPQTRVPVPNIRPWSAEYTPAQLIIAIRAMAEGEGYTDVARIAGLKTPSTAWNLRRTWERQVVEATRLTGTQRDTYLEQVRRQAEQRWLARYGTPSPAYTQGVTVAREKEEATGAAAAAGGDHHAAEAPAGGTPVLGVPVAVRAGETPAASGVEVASAAAGRARGGDAGDLRAVTPNQIQMAVGMMASGMADVEVAARAEISILQAATLRRAYSGEIEECAKQPDLARRSHYLASVMTAVAASRQGVAA